MATTLASQLQAIRTLVKVDSEPSKRPFTRPSVIFDPKEAADIDLEALHNISLSGLEALIAIDEQFARFKKDLFSFRSKDLDRDLLNTEENHRINASLSSYLRLLSGHLHLSSALKTLEYLIRKYRIYIYNMEELILCSLPYHETHTFVRIIQLLDLGNTVWKFLDGSKKTGAPPPRSVIVQQCIRDLSVLESLCNYASPSKKYLPSKPVICFCTGVVVELLGSVACVGDVHVKKILPFIILGFQCSSKVGRDHLAGILMVAAVLAKKVTLAPKLLETLIKLISELSRDAKAASDSHFFRMTILTLINLVQFQDVKLFPSKTLDVLDEIGPLPELVACLMNEFNIQKFVFVFLDSVVEHCLLEGRSPDAFITFVDVIPLKNLIDGIMSRLLLSCMRYWEKSMQEPTPGPEVIWVEKILLAIYKKYPSELRAAVFKAGNTKKDKFDHDILSSIFEVNVKLAPRSMWLGLDHPEADVRRATLSKMDLCEVEILKTRSADIHAWKNLQNSVLRRLEDEDLTVALAALSLKLLPEILESGVLLEALNKLLQRSCRVLRSDRSGNVSSAGAVALASLKRAVSEFKGQTVFAEKLSSMIFPLLLVFPSSQLLNFTALEVAKEIGWDLYDNLSGLPTGLKEVGRKRLVHFNEEIIRGLAVSLLSHFTEHTSWLISCCNAAEASRNLLFLVLVEALMAPRMDRSADLTIIEAFLPLIRSSWRDCDFSMPFVSSKKFELGDVDAKFRDVLSDLLDPYDECLNAKILAYVLCGFSEALISLEPEDLSSDFGRKWLSCQWDLLVQLSESEPRFFFEAQVHSILARSAFSRVRLLRNFFAEEGSSVPVQITGLRCFATLCSRPDDTVPFQLLHEFPSLLVPLSSADQGVRAASIECVEALHGLWSRSRGGRLPMDEIREVHLGELLDSLVRQRRMIVSDENFLSSYLLSVLGSSPAELLKAPVKNAASGLDPAAKESVLRTILESSLNLSTFARARIISLLKGMGPRITLVPGIDEMLSELLERRRGRSENLLPREVELLCVLLEVCSCHDGDGARRVHHHVLESLRSDSRLRDAAPSEPCITVLEKLSPRFYADLPPPMQDALLREFMRLSRCAYSSVQNAARVLLARIDVSISSVLGMLNAVLTRENLKRSHKKQKRPGGDSVAETADAHAVLVSLFDLLILKRDMPDRVSLVEPLFRLLRNMLEGSHDDGDDVGRGGIERTAFLILEDIFSSDLKEAVVTESDVKLLVDHASDAGDLMTRNHVFSLLTAVMRAHADKILPHMVDILWLCSESAVSQVDSYSRSVFENLVSVMVPYWLSKAGSVEELLEMFVKVLPDVPEYRRISIAVFLMKTLGDNEEGGLASLLAVLFRSSGSRSDGPDFDSPESAWEHELAARVCDQYSCAVWLGSLARILRSADCPAALRFTHRQLRDSRLAFEVEVGGADVQEKLTDLMVELVSLRSRCRGDAVGPADAVLATITRCLGPSAYFRAITRLVGSPSDPDSRKRALRLFRIAGNEIAPARDGRRTKKKKAVAGGLNSRWTELDGEARDSLDRMCESIISLIDGSGDEASSLKIRAVSALETVAGVFPQSPVLGKCLACVAANAGCSDPSVVPSFLLAAAAFVVVLGPKALPALPVLMANALAADAAPSVTVLMEAVVGSLGDFLSPYISGIVRLLAGADSGRVRKLACERIPFRLLLPSLVEAYGDAAESSSASVAGVFEMVTEVVAVAMDKPAIASWHERIFGLCLRGMDLRSRRRFSEEELAAIEERAIDAAVAVSMKLTESMFKPLFVSCVDWAGSGDDGGECSDGRAVPFYGLVDRLADTHRSLFVPYFRYLADGCARRLRGDAGARPVKKRRKAGGVSVGTWRVRSLLLSCLHKCFVHDRGSLRFLDSANFHLLMKPIVEQLGVDPPEGVDAGEVDEVIMRCVGQMAVTAGTDVMWKPLNREVLRQARGGKVRAKLLGLRVVRLLVEELREEYMVLMPETIPYLGELLEDPELSVKSLAQEVIRLMESVSGENLRQYL